MMATDKNKLDFNKLKTRRKTEAPPSPKRVYKEVEQLPKDETAPPPTSRKKVVKKEKVSKAGRKSWKENDVDYIRMSFDTPVSTRQKLKELLATKFYDVYISQDEMINVALDNFIKKHTK